ncbi:MAG: alpha/beta hydrolase [Promethearchaeota archaeon]
MSYIIIFFNLISFIFGIIYLTCSLFGISYIFVIWDIFGVIITISFFFNLIFIFYNESKSNKHTKLGNKLNLINYGYLIFFLIGMTMIPIGNFLISNNYSNTLLDNFASYAMVFCSFFGIQLIGILIAYLNIKSANNPEVWDLTKRTLSLSRRKLLIRKILKIYLKIMCYSTLLLGVHFTLILFFGVYLVYFISIIYGLFAPMWSVFISFIILATTILLLKLKNKKKNLIGYYSVGIIGFCLSIILFSPIFIAPFSISRAEINFSSAFGNDWRNKIDPIAQTYFLQTPFSMPGYYLGINPEDCIIKENILFYTNDTEGIHLFFDAYMPSNKGISLPGQNSTLIRIHGGGWVLGDKGMMNMMQMNKYFAAQGYVVFDIQYGLLEYGIPSFMAPENVVGNFNLNDMMRHIGNFTRYISSHASEYGANLNSVFVSGGSAGGQLTCATAFGIHSGYYTHIFGDTLTIKGVIPFYPAIVRTLVQGDINFINPQNLINGSSPPCLIYQGTQDNLVHPSLSQLIKDNYTSHGNNKCAIIWSDLAGHASDIYFSGYYNQIFLYYMERFMYLCVNDFI